MENVRICDSGSEIDSDDSFASDLREKNDKSYEEKSSESEYETIRVDPPSKRRKTQNPGNWNWEKVNNN